mmetsp:Transcript_3537/g.12424  ORF Transcript_3537/g.12424 Transcript_3537/m.12424 type:complete len:135 (-) Transcript_3537:293-697(-)
MPEKRRRQSKKGGCKRRRGTGKCNQRGDEREGVVEQIQLQDKALVEAFAASIEDALAEARLPQRSEEEEEEEAERVIDDLVKPEVELPLEAIDSINIPYRWVHEMPTSLERVGVLHSYVLEDSDDEFEAALQLK